MSKISVYKKNGSVAEEIELHEKIFSARVNQRLLDEVVRLYANNKRTGTVCTKTFGEVRGGGKKPWKQKGTGRARTSSIRNPIWRGGGTIFGPRPREIFYAIPKGLRQKALVSALSLKLQQGNIVVLEEVGPAVVKTKEFYAILKALKLAESSLLCVVAEADEGKKRVCNNIPRLALKAADDFNAYHVMRKKKLLVEKAALGKLEARLKEVLN